MAEARAVLGRRDESLYHLGLDEVSAELVELREPEVEARRVRVAPKVSEVLHQDERAVELFLYERRVLGTFLEHDGARLCGVVRVGQLRDERVSLGLRRRDSRVREEFVNERVGRH